MSIRPAEPTVNPVVVKALEDLLADARAGKIAGFAAAVEYNGVNWIEVFTGSDAGDLVRYIGWLDIMHFDMLCALKRIEETMTMPPPTPPTTTSTTGPRPAPTSTRLRFPRLPRE